MNKSNLKKRSKTNWKKVDALRDKDIDYSDIPELRQDFFKQAMLKMPERKITVTIRLDKNVLEWFKSRGRGYQTRINLLLKAYMEAHKNHSPKRKKAA